MEQLIAALDALAAEDLTPSFGPALLERLGPLPVAQNRIAAEVARTVREAEVSGAAEVDGLQTMASWLRGHAHCSTAGAARVVRTGRALESLPTLAEAFTAGTSPVSRRAWWPAWPSPSRWPAPPRRAWTWPGWTRSSPTSR